MNKILTEYIYFFTFAKTLIMATRIYEQRARGLGSSISKSIEKQTGVDYGATLHELVKDVYSLCYVDILTRRKNFKAKMNAHRSRSFNRLLNQYILNHDNDK